MEFEAPVNQEDFKKELPIKSGKIAIIDADLLSALPDIEPESVIVFSTKSDQPYVVEGTYSDLSLEQVCITPSVGDEEEESDELEIAESGGVKASLKSSVTSNDDAISRKLRALEDPVGNQAKHNAGDETKDKLNKRGPHVHRKSNKTKLTTEEAFITNNINKKVQKEDLQGLDLPTMKTILENMFYMAMGGWKVTDGKVHHSVINITVDPKTWTVNEDTFLVDKNTGAPFPIDKDWIFRLKTLVSDLVSEQEDEMDVEAILENVRKTRRPIT